MNRWVERALGQEGRHLMAVTSPLNSQNMFVHHQGFWLKGPLASGSRGRAGCGLGVFTALTLVLD